ncbi:hypothetical protein QE152_g35655 [Popillia japonica]|uniref:Uncharacterized protein n=1 Tax=Popillia japonica TaxID=7064 RepID=A0AAW1IFA4_POPJA
MDKLKGISTEEEKGKEKKKLKKLGNILLKILGCSEVSTEDAEEWMVCDSSDPAFQVLSGDKLIESVKEESVKEDELNVEVEANKQKCVPVLKMP